MFRPLRSDGTIHFSNLLAVWSEEPDYYVYTLFARLRREDIGPQLTQRDTSGLRLPQDLA